MMDRIDKIISDEQFVFSLEKIRELEKDRIYCGHGLNHLLDVARIAWIYVLDHGLDFNREVRP